MRGQKIIRVRGSATSSVTVEVLEPGRTRVLRGFVRADLPGLIADQKPAQVYVDRMPDARWALALADAHPKLVTVIH